MEEVVGFVFNLDVQVTRPQVGLQTDAEGAPVDATNLLGNDKPKPKRALKYSAPGEDGDAVTSTDSDTDEDIFANVGRNQLCPCGSGKKYKNCHLRH